MKLTGWGRYPEVETNLKAPRQETELAQIVKSSLSIARGNGRAYGDCAVNSDTTIHTKHFNRILNFDATCGKLIVESGVLLEDVIKIFLPKGFFLPVTPGTKFVTIGGMVAADVHGKNHHKHGSFREFIDWIDLMCWDGEVRRCSASVNHELCNWTIGGMGLTGVIIRVAFQLYPVETGWIRQRTIPAKNIQHAIDLFESELEATYSVAWIDCMSAGSNIGRSLITLGEHVRRDELAISKANMPIFPPGNDSRAIQVNLPNLTLNKFSVRLFNSLYFFKGKYAPTDGLVNWDSYFYPLDSILGWNRIYGRRGLAQYQCVIPLEQSRVGLNALLKCVSQSNCPVSLAVLKRLGKQNGNFSFPSEGFTLALDFSVSAQSFDLMNRLDYITIEYGGRLNLAKDSRVSAVTLESMDERVIEFRDFRLVQGMSKSFSSEQSNRLDL